MRYLQLSLRLLLSILLYTLGQAALAGTLTAELNRTEGTVDDSFILTLTAEGSAEGDIQVPEVPGLTFRQQGVRRAEMFNNGRRVSELHVTVGIDVEQPGTYTIASFSMQLDGERVATLPLVLKVTAAGTQNSQAAQTQKSATAAGGDTGGVFIERECSNAAPYAGQQVICFVRIYHRSNLNGGQRVGQTNADVRRFNVDGERRYQRVVNGQRYGVIELREILVPIKPGRIEVPPYGLEARIISRTKRGGGADKFFDNFGGGVFNFDMGFTEEKEVTIKSEPAIFDVKPVPDAGKPADFQGLVGRYRLSANATKDRVTAGETVTITVQIEGDGVLDGIAPPQPPTLEAIGKVYADKPEYTETVDAERGIQSKHVFKFALVPNAAGTHPLGDVKLSFFDPETQLYETLRAPLGDLVVDPGKAEQTPVLVAPSSPRSRDQMRQDVLELSKDLAGPHGGNQLIAKQTITSSFLWIMTATAAATMSSGLFSFVFMLRLRSAGGASDAVVRRSKAMRQFRVRSDLAKQMASTGRTNEALGEGYKSFRIYLGDKLALHGAALTAREAEAKLVHLGATDELRARVAAVLARIEAAEFGSQPKGPAEVPELLASLDAVAAEVDRS